MNTITASEEEIFHAAVSLPDSGRAAYLDAACLESPELRARVETLLRSHEACGFMESEVAFSTRSAEARSGGMIGRYRLLEQIGEGGFGVVWMAEQTEPVTRTVALKIIKPGMDSREVIARFETERQALALMDHPNIAKVLDAGANAQGCPYFVMELVQGVRITEYCDLKKLDTGGRLRLFIAVCQAVQHAHQKGIIHRDLKPSNILVSTGVDGQPVPKVIDFGVAKATQPSLVSEVAFTQFEQAIGTPAYMSPEQAGAGTADIDTRSDVYSLGALLYELLTGRPPFDSHELLSSGVDEMRRVIREVDPPRPSTRITSAENAKRSANERVRGAANARLVSALRGDLDWIVMRALEKDRSRRYESANGLMLDVQRFLSGEPVLACPPGVAYRTQKFIRRNKGAVVAAAILLVTFIAGIGVTTAAWLRERAALDSESRLRKEAERTMESVLRESRFNAQTAGFLDELFSGISPDEVKGEDVTLVRRVLDSSAGRMNTRLRNQPAVESNLRRIIGEAYRRLGLPVPGAERPGSNAEDRATGVKHRAEAGRELNSP